MIEFKTYSAPTSISIPFSNLGWFIQKIIITYSLAQNCWVKIEDLFFREKSPLPPNQCCSQSFRLLATKLGQIQHWYRGGKCENLEFEILSHFLNLLNFQVLSQQVLSRFVVLDYLLSLKPYNRFCTPKREETWKLNYAHSSKQFELKMTRECQIMDAWLWNQKYANAFTVKSSYFSKHFSRAVKR